MVSGFLGQITGHNSRLAYHQNEMRIPRFSYIKSRSIRIFDNLDLPQLTLSPSHHLSISPSLFTIDDVNGNDIISRRRANLVQPWLNPQI
ncbi:hypothetical protein LYNGBM3L_10050 [Moorena producens 3L]|uniref:Uncharacterized protein n=1 Tax=Moorena producens 3L TaxID=489825 RepID=F4XKD2_9CYAN|nr:hypothetical protein LYNGBM3L_10050 [Moorena producens 3L]